MTATNIIEDDGTPCLEGDALDKFLGRTRNKEGRIVKYHHINYNKRTAKRIIADMEFQNDKFKAEIATSRSRMRKGYLYTRIATNSLCIKQAEKFIS